MKDAIVFILQLPLKIYAYGLIYLFRVNRLYPELQKHYIDVKRDVAARDKGQLTTKSFLPILQKDVFTLKSVSAGVQRAASTLKSLSAAMLIYIKTSIKNSLFLHRNFPLISQYIYNRKQPQLMESFGVVVKNTKMSILNLVSIRSELIFPIRIV